MALCFEIDDELVRLATFAKFPRTALGEGCYCSLLADVGYFHTGICDELQCYNCNFKMRLNNSVDTLIMRHRTYSPSCNVACRSLSLELVITANNANNENNYQQYQYCRENNLAAISHNTCEDTSNKNVVLTIDGLVIVDGCNRSTNHGSYDIELDNSITHLTLASNYKDTQNFSENSVDENDYKYEKNRLSTFRTWPKEDIVQPKLLACDGFIYTLLGDRVKCVFCDGMLRAWEKNDNPAEEHDRHYPACPFVNGCDVGNIPITVDPRRKRKPQKISQHMSTNLGGSNKIDAREIKARLDTPVVRNIHAMGYPMDLIRNVLLEQLTSCGKDFPNMISFIEALKTKQNEITISEAHCDVAAAAASVPLNSSSFQSIAAGSSKNFDHEQRQNSGKNDNTLFNNNNKQLMAENLSSSSDMLKTNNSDDLNENLEKENLKKKRKKKKKKTKKSTEPSENQPLSANESQKENEKKNSNQNLKTSQLPIPNQMQYINHMVTVNKASEKIEGQQTLTLAPSTSIVKTGKCSLCDQEDINTALIPCGHTYFCSNCCEPLINCPVCKANIHTKIKVYLTS